MHYLGTYFLYASNFPKIVLYISGSHLQNKKENTQRNDTHTLVTPPLTFPSLIYLLPHGVDLPPEIFQLWPTPALLDCYGVPHRLISFAPMASLRRQFPTAPTVSARGLAQGRSRRGITSSAASAPRRPPAFSCL
jgi:hypothetical protein